MNNPQKTTVAFAGEKCVDFVPDFFAPKVTKSLGFFLTVVFPSPFDERLFPRIRGIQEISSSGKKSTISCVL